jgi:hypothetical protein
MANEQRARARLTATHLAQASVELAVARDALAMVQDVPRRLEGRMEGAGTPSPDLYGEIARELDERIWPGFADATAGLQRARDHLAVLAVCAEPAPWPARAR